MLVKPPSAPAPLGRKWDMFPTAAGGCAKVADGERSQAESRVCRNHADE